MLSHQNTRPEKPARVVVLGAGGVLGKPLLAGLRADGIAAIGVGSAEIDLQAADATEKLLGLLKADDAVVFLSALTPDKGRDVATLMKNLRMAEAVANAVAAALSSLGVQPHELPLTPPRVWEMIQAARQSRAGERS